jgi:AcrR family transcriptional regulator
LDRGGPAEVTLREVGRLAGVSHNAPYKHFADKEELLAAIAAKDLRNRCELIESLVSEQKPIDALRKFGHAYVSWARAKPARFRLSFGAWRIGSDELRQAVAASRAQMVWIVKAAQACSELPPGDAERLVALMLALFHGAASEALAGDLSFAVKGKANPEDIIDDLLENLAPSTASRSKGDMRVFRQRVKPAGLSARRPSV